MLKVLHRDKLKSSAIRNQTGVADIIAKKKKQSKWEWSGHAVARRNDNRWT